MATFNEHLFIWCLPGFSPAQTMPHVVGEQLPQHAPRVRSRKCTHFGATSRGERPLYVPLLCKTYGKHTQNISFTNKTKQPSSLGLKLGRTAAVYRTIDVCSLPQVLSTTTPQFPPQTGSSNSSDRNYTHNTNPGGRYVSGTLLNILV